MTGVDRAGLRALLVCVGFEWEGILVVIVDAIDVYSFFGIGFKIDVGGVGIGIIGVVA